MTEKREEKREVVEKLKVRQLEQQSLREKRRQVLGIGSIKELENTIAKLEWKMIHTTLTLKEEKDMMARIKKFSGLKDQVREFEEREKAFRMGAEEQKKLECKFKEILKELAAAAAWNELQLSRDGPKRQLSTLNYEMHKIRWQLEESNARKPHLLEEKRRLRGVMLCYSRGHIDSTIQVPMAQQTSCQQCQRGR
mmetsp:Transcript_6182/g.9520  ORF Transcript_6182/g.9520 Transcript_6182/m.9520 type:complete len:195 (+) Transcript_6182:288-872(+)